MDLDYRHELNIEIQGFACERVIAVHGDRRFIHRGYREAHDLAGLVLRLQLHADGWCHIVRELIARHVLNQLIVARAEKAEIEARLS